MLPGKASRRPSRLIVVALRLPLPGQFAFSFFVFSPSLQEYYQWPLLAASRTGEAAESLSGSAGMCHSLPYLLLLPTRTLLC